MGFNESNGCYFNIDIERGLTFSKSLVIERKQLDFTKYKKKKKKY